LPIQANGAQEGRAGDLIVSDVIDLHTAGAGVSQDHVVFAPATEIAEAHHLPIQTNRAQEGGVRDEIVADVINFEAAGGQGIVKGDVRAAAVEEAVLDKVAVGVRPDDLAEVVDAVGSGAVDAQGMVEGGVGEVPA